MELLIVENRTRHKR
ncbi:hypothetical protein A2U01_0118783, partial [Trifolium medium]|nr:hypothetical protein [Trifolium medium]